MPLRERQLRALDALEWLHDPGARAEGRTLLLAIAAIRMACRNPGMAIDVFDHSPTNVAHREAEELLRGLVMGDPRLSAFAVLQDQRLVLNLPQRIIDWLPQESAYAGVRASALGRAAGARLARMTDEATPVPSLRGSMSELLAFNQEVSRRTAAMRLNDAARTMQEAQQTDTIRDDFDAFHGGEDHTPFPEADTISQEMADRVMAEQVPEVASTDFDKKAAPKKKKPAPKPEPLSVWDRLVADDD